MRSDIRKSVLLRVFTSDISSRKSLACKLKKVQCVIFTGKFGEILDFLEVDMQVDYVTNCPNSRILLLGVSLLGTFNWPQHMRSLNKYYDIL